MKTNPENTSAIDAYAQETLLSSIGNDSIRKKTEDYLRTLGSIDELMRQAREYVKSLDNDNPN